MVDPRYFAPFNLGDILTQAEQIKSARLRDQMAQQQMQDQQAERQALGQLFGGSNPTPNSPAIGALMRVNPQMGFQVQKYFDGLSEDQRKREADKWKVAAPALTDMMQIPYAQRRDYLQRAAPVLTANGWTPEELQSFDPSDENLRALAHSAMTVNEVIDANTLKWNPIGENGSFATDQFGNPVGSGNPFAPQSGKQPTADAVFGSLIQQESGGRPGIRGPQTAYGVPLGKTQMLPDTAREMAGKLGLPWRPDLLAGTSAEASQYQEKLGRAYFDEGLQKYGGNIELALKYYHGGPDESKWGPKTNAYAKSVLARAGRASNPDVIRQQARDAIAAGADPEAVRQRAAALGVNL
jgi:soluble lytic murein transglycosylase-like protein